MAGVRGKCFMFEFYDTLEGIYNHLPNYATKVVLGDFNAKIGKETMFRPTIGNYSLHDITNENGLRLVSFAISKDLSIKSTKFPHKGIHKATWVSPDQRTKNQIDHILINSRRQSSITDIRTFRGANMNSDHYLVIAKYTERISTQRMKRSDIKHIDTDELKKEEKQQLYSLKLDESLSQLMSRISDNDSIEERWNAIKTSILETSSQILGQKTRKKNTWFDEECKRSLAEEKNLRILALQTPTFENKEKHRKEKIRTKKLLRKKKKGKRKRKT